MPTSFDLFGTLVAAERPEIPAAAVADALGTEPASLVHVGDDPETDDGVEAVGGRAILLNETPLREVPRALGVAACD